MTNLEFYKDELSKIVKEGKVIAIVNDKPTNCMGVTCHTCDRYDKCNDAELIRWLVAEHLVKEHIEETNNCKICKNLKVDDKILVSYTGDKWCKRHFAGYDSESDCVLTFASGYTSWTTDTIYPISQWKYVKLPEEEGEDC